MLYHYWLPSIFNSLITDTNKRKTSKSNCPYHRGIPEILQVTSEWRPILRCLC